MARVSDEWIERAIESFEKDFECGDEDVVSALTELRERRAAEKQAEIDYYSNETHT